jgi:hypothetical protein
MKKRSPSSIPLNLDHYSYVSSTNILQLWEAAKHYNQSGLYRTTLMFLVQQPDDMKFLHLSSTAAIWHEVSASQAQSRNLSRLG